MSSLTSGVVLGRERVGLRFPSFCAFVMLASAGFVGWLERASSPQVAADQGLMTVLGIVIPLATYAWVGQLFGQGGVRSGLWDVARYGANRRAAFIGAWLYGAACLAVLGGLSAVVVVAAARGVGDPGLIADLGTSLWIGALGGLAYASWLSLGASVGAGGAGRFIALAVDWVLGSTTALFALPWPRAHLRSLAGGAGVADLSQVDSCAVLIALTLTYVAVAALSMRR